MTEFLPLRKHAIGNVAPTELYANDLGIPVDTGEIALKFTKLQ
jgi:hypothetical protein